MVMKTNSMEQGPLWKANTSSATQEIFRILRNPRIHYHVHKSPTLVPILSQINPVRILPTDLFNIHFNIILPCKHKYHEHWKYLF
jgi:hypothetical protein